MLGYSGDFFVVGLGVNYTRKSTTLGPNQFSQLPQEVILTGIDIGPAARFRLASTLDRKLELIGAVDFRLQRATAGMDQLTGSPERKLAGFLFSAGPGIRYWVHSRLSLGYTVQVAYSVLEGQQALRPQIDPNMVVVIDPNMFPDPTLSFEVTSISFTGAFQLLAVF